MNSLQIFKKQARTVVLTQECPIPPFAQVIYTRGVPLFTDTAKGSNSCPFWQSGSIALLDALKFREMYEIFGSLTCFCFTGKNKNRNKNKGHLPFYTSKHLSHLKNGTFITFILIFSYIDCYISTNISFVQTDHEEIF